MSRFGRRTFLASSTGLAAGAAVAGALPAGIASAAGEDAERPLAGVLAAAGSAGTLRTSGLTVNGLVAPVGVDPDDCSFAWIVQALGRAVTQTAFRIVVRRTDPAHAGLAWDSGTVVSARQAFVAYGGPSLAADAAYEWTVQPRGPAGRWGPVSAPARFTTALRAADWRAQWLQPAGNSQQPDRVTYLRTEVTPAAGTFRATASVSAAHTYRLYVDGVPVDAWPSFSYPDEQYVRAVDLTGALAGGRTSAIGVLHRWYGPGQGRPASAPGLLFQLSLEYDDGRHYLVVSDASWRERPAEWLPSPQRNPDGGDFVEWIDGREHPQGWSEPGYDDSAWSAVTVIGPAGTAPFTTTFPQRTTIRESPVHPVSLHTAAGGSVVADFGAIYPARPWAEFAPGQAGSTISMRAGYLLDPDGQVSTLHGTQETNLSFSYIMGTGGQQAFEAFTYFGYRYVQIDNLPQHPSRDQITAITRHTAMPDVATATFSSDNRMLNAVWRLMARSCLLCSQEQFVDTPTREKGQFLWDAANESEAVMRVYGDQNMSWQALRDVARGQARYWPNGCVNAIYPNDDGARFFGTSTARYAEWLWRYYVSTGDTDTATTLYPSVSQAADWLWSARQAGNGLLYGLADTSDGDPVYGYDLSVAADTVSNVLAVNAFTRVAQVADLAGDATGAATHRARAAQLAAAVNATLRRADGVYVDGVQATGAQSASASQEANALALAYGVVPAADVAAVGAHVHSLGIDLGPNHGLELMRALAAADLPEAMVQTLTDPTVGGWAHIVETGGTFTWEEWEPSDLIGDSLSHGWGSSALVAMQETLLGVSLEQPGADGTVRAVVSPPSAGLDRAAGSVPTIAGPVQVSWQRRGQGMTMALTVPANAAATVRIPASAPASVREGGAAAATAPGIKMVSTGDGVVVLSVGSGDYHFTSA
jgi:alpha-L-rhamnosidase